MIKETESTSRAPLVDFQKMPAPNEVSIPRVGISRFRIPLLWMHENDKLMSHDSEVSMSVRLPAGKMGVNMSRFVSVLQEEAQYPVNRDFLSGLLRRLQRDLRDSESEDLLNSVRVEFALSYPLKQKALRSDLWGWQYYPLRVVSELKEGRELIHQLEIDYEYSSACPCSLSLAEQYESEFRKGLTSEGSGTAIAHSQRSRAKVKVELSPESELDVESIVDLLREAIPTETQSMVKRTDEQAFAILNGQHPIFVEHAARRLRKVLNSAEWITDWIVEIEHFESLHSHNAYAMIQKHS